MSGMTEIIETGQEHPDHPAKARMLILEAEEIQCKGLVLGLRDEWLEPSGTANPRQAIQLARSENFQVVLADLHCPTMDGLQVARDLRAAAPRALLVVLSTRTDAAFVDLLAGLGVDTVLEKPVDLDRLKQFVGLRLRGLDDQRA